MPDVDVLLVCGSTRAGSTNLAALHAVQRLTPHRTDLYDRLVDLPAFVPGDEAPPDVVADLLARITAAATVLFCTPEYAGALPGSLKNLLDWTVGGGELYEKPVAWLDVANPGRGAGARAELRTVLGYVGARLVEKACAPVTVLRDGGEPRVDPAAEPALRTAVAALVAAAND